MCRQAFIKRTRARVGGVVLGALLFASASRASAASCTPVPVYEDGSAAGVTCADGPGPGLVLLSLDDAWAPRILSETPELPQAYRATFVALASERMGTGNEWREPRRARYFELFGVFPSIGVLRRRLLDADRHECHAGVDDTGLRELKRTIAPWDPAPRPALSGARPAAVAALQAHLTCERLLPSSARAGRLDTAEALAAYQRLHMIPSSPVLDAATREVLVTPSRELDFRALLRALRERVVDAMGLIEDGSARNGWEPVLGRYIDAPEYRYELRAAPLEHGAPDLISRATAAAAAALGWVSPEAASAALDQRPTGLVALIVPETPAYYGAPLELRVEIDRGDVWTSYPFDAQGRALTSPVVNRPTLTVFAETAAGDVPLVRWPTTIGGWQREKVGPGWNVWRYKPSPTGHFLWRDLIAAPAWFPPPSTPDRELVEQGPDGQWMANDRAIRTHGSGNYRSILRGSSHGCHRLFNHLAIRLGSFLLAHGEAVRHGQGAAEYTRSVRWRGRVFRLHAASRGYRFELSPPIDVRILPGRSVRTRRSLAPIAVSRAPDTGPAALEIAECEEIPTG